jgi:SAM-dependent methyltransferase
MSGPRGREALEERARVEDVYGRYARSRAKRRAWAADNPGNAAMRAELLRRTLERIGGRVADGGSVLDIGCGVGWWLCRLAEHGVPEARLAGVDLLDERVHRARKHAPRADIRRADAAALPFADGAFAVALLFTTLSSSRDSARRARMLLEARRVLEPHGLVLVYEPRVPSPLNPNTARVRQAELDAVPDTRSTHEPLTVLPPLARRLGDRTDRLYPRLAGHRWLLSHRLSVLEMLG